MSTVWDNDGRRSQAQGAPHLWDGHVEGTRRLDGEDIVGTMAHELHAPRQTIPHARGWHHTALWLTCRTRRVHDVHHLWGRPGLANVLRCGSCGRGADMALLDDVPCEVNVQEADSANNLAHLCNDTFEVFLRGIDRNGPSPRLRENVCCSSHRPRRIARDEGGASAKRRELGDGERGRPLEDQTDDVRCTLLAASRLRRSPKGPSQGLNCRVYLQE
mmetsp:Transcript_46492/g.129390  ORF Transcript_46492/g.129390 Transcript_46492/m.129390 type:complete len:217 (+) Transcript_46492:179-829(+)